MRVPSFQVCPLCLKRITPPAARCDSHLLPAQVYRVLRAKGQKNPNPILISGSRVLATSRQLQQPLLCRDCEDRFNNRGERWVLAKAFTDNGTFGLRNLLLEAQPLHKTDRLAVFAASQIMGIDCAQLGYFAASVFWRAAVVEWATAGPSVHIDLGPYLEPLRRFLVDESPFPENTALCVRVLTIDGLLQTAEVPITTCSQPWFIHQFSIPGIAFSLSVGGRLPNEVRRLCFTKSAEHFIFLVPDLDTQMWMAGARLCFEGMTAQASRESTT